MDTFDLEANDPHCLTRDRADVLLADAPWQRLLVMGDSIAGGDGDPVAGYLDRSWGDRLAIALRAHGRSVVYLNLGTFGARTAEIRAGQLPQAVAFGPDLAVVAAGANDAFRRSFAPSAVAADLERIVGDLTAAGALTWSPSAASTWA